MLWQFKLLSEFNEKFLQLITWRRKIMQNNEWREHLIHQLKRKNLNWTSSSLELTFRLNSSAFFVYYFTRIFMCHSFTQWSFSMGWILKEIKFIKIREHFRSFIICFSLVLIFICIHTSQWLRLILFQIKVFVACKVSDYKIETVLNQNKMMIKF